MTDVTRILNAIEGGDQKAPEELLPLVYEELRLLAARRLAQEKPGHTLQATALVHEAYLRLLGDQRPNWEGRGHFFAAAAEAMRRILIDSARRKQTTKRGGHWHRVRWQDLETPFDRSAEDLLALDEALTLLQETDVHAAQVLKLRYFAGLTIAQIAELQGSTERTVLNNLAFARAWLHREMTKNSQ